MQNEKHNSLFEAKAATPSNISSNHSYSGRMSNSADSWSNASIPLSILTNSGGFQQQQQQQLVQATSIHPDAAYLSQAEHSKTNERGVNAYSSFSTQDTKDGCSTLKEHDYIGFSSGSSSPGQANFFTGRLVEEKFALALDSKETELRLGIGPPQEFQTAGISPVQSAQNEAKPDIAVRTDEGYGRVVHESNTSLTEKTGKEITGTQSDVEQLPSAEAGSFPKPFSSIDRKVEEMAEHAWPFHSQDKFECWTGERFSQARRGFVQGSNVIEKQLFPSQEVYHFVKEHPWASHKTATFQQGSVQDKNFITQSTAVARQDVLKQGVSQFPNVSAVPAQWKPQAGLTDFYLYAQGDKSSFEAAAAAAKQKYWQAQAPGPFEGFWAPSNMHVSQSTKVSEHEARKGVSNGFCGAEVTTPLPKSTVPAKRGFLDALGSSDNRSGPGDSKANVVVPVSAPFFGGKFQVAQGVMQGEGFSGSQGAATHPSAPGMYLWNNANNLPGGWKMSVEQTKGAFGAAVACNPPPGSISWQPKGPIGNSELSSGPKQTHVKTTPAEGTHTAQKENDRGHEEVANASQRAPVVGWPPIRSFRKNTLASHPKQNGDEHDTHLAPSDGPEASSSKMFVKANMDGIHIGRKVDLKAYDSYDSLKLALQEMFQQFVSGYNGGQGSSANQTSATDPTKQLNLLDGSDYVLTHEDKDGDWMLVGDVPWAMFASTVRRIRIMKSSDAAGLGQRVSAKQK